MMRSADLPNPFMRYAKTHHRTITGGDQRLQTFEVLATTIGDGVGKHTVAIVLLK